MISIVIPAFNGAEFSDAALAPIEAQEFTDRQVSPADDGFAVRLQPAGYKRGIRGPRYAAPIWVMKRRVDRIRSGAADPAEERRFLFGECMGDPEGTGEWTL